MIALVAEARYGYEGKQFIARITGRDSKFTFAREFVGRRSGKRNGTTEADLDTPGLYEVCDVDGKGNKDSRYVLLFELPDGVLLKLRGTADNADGIDGKDAAMTIAKRMDAGESFDRIVAVIAGADGKPAYRIQTKAEAQKEISRMTADSAVEQCWAILQSLPERQAKQVLSALKLRVSPPKTAITEEPAQENTHASA